MNVKGPPELCEPENQETRATETVWIILHDLAMLDQVNDLLNCALPN